MGGMLGAGLFQGLAQPLGQLPGMIQKREVMELQKKQLDASLKAQEINQQLQQMKMQEIGRKVTAGQQFAKLLQGGQIPGLESIPEGGRSLIAGALAAGDEGAAKLLMERMIPKPQEPVKLGEGEALVNPQTGESIVERKPKGQAAPAELNAFAKAKYGADYNQLDQAQQAQAFSEFRAMEESASQRRARAAMSPIAAAQAAGMKSFASTIGSLMAKEEAPIPAGDLNKFVDSSALAEGMIVHPPPGMTMKQAGQAGFRAADPKQLENLTEMDKSDLIIGNIKTMTDKMMTAKTPLEAIGQAAKLGAGAMTRLDPEARLYKDTIDAFIGNISRTHGGQTGVLTDKDIDLVKRGMPQFGDTAQAKDVKIAILQELNSVGKDAQTRILKGDSPKTVRAGARARIDELLGKLQGVAAQPQAPAAGGKVIKMTPIP